MYSFEARELIVHDDGDGRGAWPRGVAPCDWWELSLMTFVFVVRAWTLAHHHDLTDLGRHGAVEAVGVQTLRWEERGPNMSQYNHV